MTKATPTLIDLRKLIGTSVILARHAGEIIRQVIEDSKKNGVKNEGLGIMNKSGIEGAQPDMAEDFDPQTIADTRAQFVIWRGMRSVFGPHLALVGEEGDNDADRIDLQSLPQQMQDIVNSYPPSKESIDAVLLPQFVLPDELQLIPLEDVVVWIDPLDGTREFVLGNYHNVTTLIGISVRGRPVAGLISEPFADRVVYGCKGAGVVDGDIIVTPRNVSQIPVPVVSSGRFTGPTLELYEILKFNKLTSEPIRTGGAGCKYLQVIRGNADFWIFPRAGCCRWDTCSGDALIEALGGHSTGFDGSLYTYNRVTDGSAISCHEVAAAYANTHGQLMAIDDGTYRSILPWSKFLPHLRFLNTGIQSIHPELRLEEYKITPNRGIIGKHSTVFWMQSNYSDANNARSSEHWVVKSIDADNMPERSAQKWDRDYRSYKTETAMLMWENSHPSKLPFTATVHACLSVDPTNSHKGFKSLFVMQDLEQSGWHQLMLHSTPMAKQVLVWLADYHRQTLEWQDLASSLMSSGTFYDPKHTQFQVGIGYGPSATYQRIATQLTADTSIDEELRAFLTGQNTSSFHADFDRMYHEACASLSDIRAKFKLPIVHGDFKTANIFMRPDNEEYIESRSHDYLRVIDFQWSGRNHGLFDVVYYLLSSVDLSAYASSENSCLEPIRELCADYMVEFYGAEHGPLNDESHRLMLYIIVLYITVALESQMGLVKNVSAWIHEGHSNMNRCSHNRCFKHLHYLFRLLGEAVNTQTQNPHTNTH